MSYTSEKEKLASLEYFTTFPVSSGIEVAAAVDLPSKLVVLKASTPDPLFLHWGIAVKHPKEWRSPHSDSSLKLSDDSELWDEKAVQTPFKAEDGFSSLELPLPDCLAINFVLKDADTWYNNDNKDFCIPLKPTDTSVVADPVAPMVQEIIEAEGNRGSWTLMHRFGLCEKWVKRLGDSREGCLWIYIWMRYSAMRKLDWQRHFNTKPKDLSWAQHQLTFALTDKLCSAQRTPFLNPCRLLRQVLASLGKGGDFGQRIRDQILEIMHKNGVKEQHGTFYEQWHQKLHNNTTPDDVGICEAIIAFNETNDGHRYRHVLESHGIDQARLASYDRAITGYPEYMPHLLPDLRDFLKTLKAIHGSNDLHDLLRQAMWAASSGLQGQFGEVMENTGHWDTLKQMQRVTGARQQLWRELGHSDLNKKRDLHFADAALESNVRLLTEKIIHVQLDPGLLIWELNMLLENFVLTCDVEEAGIVRTDFKLLSDRCAGQFQTDTTLARMLKAVADRVLRLLGSFVDEYNQDLAPKAKHLGRGCKVDDETSEMFAEESVRGSLMFAVSIVLKKLDAHLRRATGLSAWQIISPRKTAQGRVLLVESMGEVTYTKFEESTVLVVARVGGEEEIPEGVTALLTGSELDALAHICVRARNGQVLLAVCHDEGLLEQIKQKNGKAVKVHMKGSGIELEEVEALDAPAAAAELGSSLPVPPAVERLLLSAEDFSRTTSGAKSNNCAFLSAHPNDLFSVPKNLVMPFGVCELMLEQSPGSAEYASLLEALRSSSDVKAVLAKLKGVIQQISPTDAQKTELIEGLSQIGLKEDDWEEAWSAIKGVWASKFNERALLSTKKVGIPIEDIRMSVLCQQVIPADYAFVLHTKNPTNNNPDELYGELVVGLGETLVGAYEGRALSFSVEKSSGRVDILAFPNKSVALKGQGFIFRSDSNSEDLAGFAGAGLFDSMMMSRAKTVSLCYHNEPIFTDGGFRDSLIQRLLAVGVEVERLYEGQPQDIEGVLQGDQIFVVQTRPQV
jgi:alpha-glucan,water dikinase